MIYLSKPLFTDFFNEPFPEARDEEHLFIDIPGATSKDVSVEVKNGGLEIKANYQKAGKTASYAKVYALAPTVDVDQITAHVENGVLVIYLPKKASAKGKAIQVT